MMGAGIAYSCARAGMEVVLKDVAARGGREGQGLLREAARQGDRARQARPRRRSDEMLGRITADRRPGRPRRLRPGHRGGLRGPDASRHQVFAEVAGTSNPDALLCSNTSTLPITELADRRRPARGLHRPALLLARSTRCRWSRSSRASRPPTRRSPRPTTWSSRSARPRSWSTTAAASTPRGSSARWSTRAWRCSPRACTRCRSSGPPPRPATRSAPLQLTDELNMELMAKIAQGHRGRRRARRHAVRRAPGHARSSPG